MSPLPTPTLAARPIADQARSILGFLAAHGHRLSEHDACQACLNLPPDSKQAAKQLRINLASYGVDIKHTHALKAVSVAREADGFLGLDTSPQYEVASWSPDAPGVSAERKGFAAFSDAADEVCIRLREQYEGDSPWVRLQSRSTHLLLSGASELTGSVWHILLALAQSEGAKVTFPAQPPLERFAERIRRLVEGELGGWLDGFFDVKQAFEQGDFSSTTRAESSLPDLAGFSNECLPSQLPSLGETTGWQLCEPLSFAEWNQFRSRYDRFFKRQSTPLFQWVSGIQQQTQEPRFEAVPLHLTRLNAAMAAKGLSWHDLHLRLGTPHHQVMIDFQDGKGSLAYLPALAEALDIADPNTLLAPTRSSPRIPLPLHSDIGMWLSRIDAVVPEREFLPQVQRDWVERLSTFCAVPYEQRRTWSKRLPPGLETLNQEIRFAGLIVCAGMGVRFVKDLPLGWLRPASVSLLEFDRQIDVLTQGGRLDAENRSMDIGAERDPVTPEWLQRFNKPKFKASDLLRYSDMVHQHIDPDDDEKARFTSKVFAGVKVFKDDPEKAHAASIRMEALSGLMERRPIEPWIRKSRNGDGSLMISEAAFEAAARCELTAIEQRPGFEEQTFYMLCVQYARKYT